MENTVYGGDPEQNKSTQQDRDPDDPETTIFITIKIRGSTSGNSYGCGMQNGNASE